MSITNEVHEFPNFPIEKQLFYVPGTSSPGGFTTGGVRITTYEPGGFGQLDIQPALQVNEWLYPETSWLMSQGSGKILRARMAPTPQMAGGLAMRPGVPWDSDLLWSNDALWAGDLSLSFAANALEGTTRVIVETTNYGLIFSRGHLVGHRHSAYMIDKVISTSGSQMELSVSPPLRRDIASGDQLFNRPYFTGQISNQNEIIATYDAEMVGLIQMPKISLTEVIIND